MRTKFIRFMVLLLYVFGADAAVACVPSASAHNVGLIYPLYIAPPDPAYTQIESLATTYPNVPVITILNPSNGPGTGANLPPDVCSDYPGIVEPCYTNAITALKAAGITVIGYNPTCYGASEGMNAGCAESGPGYDYPGEDQATIQAMSDDWYSYYPGTQGIFYDEMANISSSTACTFGTSSHDCVTFYQNITSYVHTGYGSNQIVFGNPGSPTLSPYISASPVTADVIMVYESPGFPNATQSTSNGVCVTGRCANAVFNTAYVATGSTSFQTMYDNVQWVFATDAPTSNPYDVAPTYLATEMAALSAYDGTGAVSCPIFPGFL